MKRRRHHNEVSVEPVRLDGRAYRLIARHAATTYAFRRFGVFKTSGRPLRIEVEGSDGELTVIPIRDLQSMIMGALLMLSVVLVVVTSLGRSGR